MNERKPTFSVVIPARNEVANIERCLNAIGQAMGGRDDVEIIVADNHSTDETVETARRGGARAVVPPERVSIAQLRNFGATESHGGTILFLDADMEVPPDWLNAISRHFDGNGVDVLGFVEDIPADAPWFARIWSERIRARRGQVMDVDYLPGRNICVRRSWFDRVGGLDAGLSTSEDKDFAMRLRHAGARVISAPSPNPIHWGYERTLKELVRKEFWRQSNHINMIRRHGLTARLVRFPLLSTLHALWPFLALGMGITVGWTVALAVLAGWWVPGLGMALRHRLSRGGPVKLLQFTFLYWLRFTVAGWAVLFEALLGFRPKD